MASNSRTAAAAARGRGGQARRGHKARPARARARADDGVTLGVALTIAEAAQCARALTAMLARGTARTDARALKSVDTAGMQLLLAAAAAAQERGLTLQVRGGARLLRGAAEALGLGGDLAAVMELSA
jgi:ABC-type transporter Mla MlaB component